MSDYKQQISDLDNQMDNCLKVVEEHRTRSSKYDKDLIDYQNSEKTFFADNNKYKIDLSKWENDKKTYYSNIRGERQEGLCGGVDGNDKRTSCHLKEPKQKWDWDSNTSSKGCGGMFEIKTRPKCKRTDSYSNELLAAWENKYRRPIEPVQEILKLPIPPTLGSVTCCGIDLSNMTANSGVNISDIKQTCGNEKTKVLNNATPVAVPQKNNTPLVVGAQSTPPNEDKNDNMILIITLIAVGFLVVGLALLGLWLYFRQKPTI